jgi:hypothetical protein
VFTERTVEMMTETTQRSETQTTTQDELADAVKDENRDNMNFGFTNTTSYRLASVLQDNATAAFLSTMRR